jgi:hypothetical protein
MGRYRIIHDAEYRFSGFSCFLVNDADHSLFYDAFQQIIIPFPMVQKMGDGSPVAGTAFFKINCLAFEAYAVNRHNNGQYMLDICMRKQSA